MTRILPPALVLILSLAACGEEGDGDVLPDPDGPPGPEGYCESLGAWPLGWGSFEAEVLQLTNERRAADATCGGTLYPATHALEPSAGLRCPARNHAVDMAERDYVEHDSPEGETVADRLAKVPYAYEIAGENVAAGQPTPAEVVAGWMSSPGHCANIMSAAFTEIGVGYVREFGTDRYVHYWVQVFAAPL